MRVLIDTDPGLGKRGADVDDGLALFFMLNNPEFFEIEGITTVFGNTPMNKGYKLLEKYLDVAKRTEIPYFKGAISKADLGMPTEASKFIVKKIKENPGELTLLTLGPLTNVATAIKIYPELLNDLNMLIMMGGVLEPLNPFSKRESFKAEAEKFFTHIEFNFGSDPQATKAVIESKTYKSRILMALDICCKAIFKQVHFNIIESVNTPITRFIAENLKFWLNIWKNSDKGGFFPFDTFVPIYLFKPNLFKKKDYFFIVDTEKYPGKIIIEGNKQNLVPITFCTDFNDPNGDKKFMDLLISNLIKY
jgi:purine nucleosidase